MPKQDRTITLRRMIQQTGHCVAEALSIVEKGEDTRCAIDDLEQAGMLIEKCLEDARNFHKLKER